MATVDTNAGKLPTASAFRDYLSHHVKAQRLPNPCPCDRCGEGLRCWRTMEAETLCEPCLRTQHGFDQGDAFARRFLTELVDDLNA